MKDNQERKIKEKIGQMLIESRFHEVDNLSDIFVEHYIDNEVYDLMESYYHVDSILERNIEMVEEFVDFDPDNEDSPYIAFPLINSTYTELLYPYTHHYASTQSETED